MALVTLDQFTKIWETHCNPVSSGWAATRRSELKHALACCADYELEGQVPRRPLYCLRHTFISHLLDGGIAPIRVAQLVGDTVQTILKAYYRWTKELDDEGLAAALQLGPPKPRLRVVPAKVAALQTPGRRGKLRSVR